MSTQANSNDFCLPDLGEGLGDAELVEWCVKIGQQVQENDILAKMETAKALVEVPSPRAGTIAALHGKPGEAVKVGSPLVTFKSSGSVAPSEEVENAFNDLERPPDAGSVVGKLAVSGESDSSQHALATPAVRRRAKELGVEIERVAGTGIGGRVMLHDVENAAHEHGRGSRASEKSDGVSGSEGRMPPGAEITLTPTLSSSSLSLRAEGRSTGRGGKDATSVGKDARSGGEDGASGGTGGGGDDSERIPFRGVRRTIAEHLRYSVSHAVHFTVMDEADVTGLDELRRRLVLASNEKITLLPFVAIAVSRVLGGACGAQFRRLNSTVDDDRQEIVQHRAIHLGIATDTEAGLMVPVIRDAGAMGVLQISRQIGELAKAARDRSIPPHRLTGSTFTISNFGALGGRFGTPIINYPEAGILAVGRAHEGVIVRQGMLGVGKLLPLSLSADHRVIDGATASTALAKIIDLLQRPDVLLPPE